MATFINHINGNVLVDAYAAVLDLINVDGEGDGGKDVADSPKNPTEFYQVKSSIRGAISSLTLSEKFNKFIPLLVGEPGTAEEIRKSVEEFGAWCEPGLPHRENFLRECCRVRSNCEA